jgi:hypothetical protein
VSPPEFSSRGKSLLYPCVAPPNPSAAPSDGLHATLEARTPRMNGGRSIALASPYRAFKQGSPDLSNPSRHQCLSPLHFRLCPMLCAPHLCTPRAAPWGKPPHTRVAEPRRGALSPHPRHSGAPAAPSPFALQLNRRSRERKSRGRREEGERKRGAEHHHVDAQGRVVVNHDAAARSRGRRCPGAPCRSRGR